ncbi:MAG: glycosyltransferase [Acidimicrobiales bacterium]
MKCDTDLESGETTPQIIETPAASVQVCRATDLSVVIPCHNESATLPTQLAALGAERWHGDWEIIVVDNASTDDTAEIARTFVSPIPIRVVAAHHGRGVAYARNAGIAASSARSIAICDGDDLIAPGWVAAIGDALEQYPLVSSRLDTTRLNPTWLASTRPLPDDGLPVFGGVRFAHGGACGMHRTVWESLGGYDSAFDGVEDIEFGLRAQAAGFTPVRAGDATVHYRLRQGLGQVWCQGVGYGRRRFDLIARARSLGIAPPPRSAGWKSIAWLALRLPTIVTRRGRYSWTWTLASRVGVVRGALEARPLSAPRRGIATTPSSPARSHAVLVTFRRPDLLIDHLSRLAGQTAPLDTLVVVDNGADPEIRRLVETADPVPAETVLYLPLAGNPGPAGGFTAGLAELLPVIDDHDLVVLLDDNDPPHRDETFAEVQAVFRELQSTHGNVGGVGTWGASLRRGGRLRTETSRDPMPVDYLSGNGCPHYLAGALRAVDGPDPALFFGFEELDLGLALKRAGYRIWSSGIAREHGLAAMVAPTTARAGVQPPSWRRYYSFRNLVIVLRKDGRRFDAVCVSALAGLAKPLVNLAVSPRVAWTNLRVNSAALRDGWCGRLGKRVDPVDLPRHLR